jgi:sugar lactone lactonase YvrE
LGSSEVFATIPASHHLVEGLIWNPKARSLYASTVVDGTLLAVRPGGPVSIAASLGPGSPLGGAYDPRGDRIWISSAVIEQTPKAGPGFSGLLSIEPRTFAITRIPAPAGSTLGDVAIARDGTVYASDGLKGGIYRCRPGCVTLQSFVPAGALFSAQGMVISQDQKRLYVADRRYGIAIVDRAS